jgi:multicomponent Na+:H+ antiporter subunit G
VTLVQNILTIILVLGGTVFMLVGSVGLNRLPDFYTRAHASGKVDTLGILMFVSGLAVYQGFSLDAAKLLLIIVFVAITSPVASHQMARRALLFGLKPWHGRDRDNEEAR